MKIAILTSKNQWFIPYAKELASKIKNCVVIFSHTQLTQNFDICFVLSYHKIIDKKYLQNNKHNIVVHASNLPKGKGFAPMFWQILEGKNDIIFSMFEINEEIDGGDIYMKKTLCLSGYELYDELRDKQARFINNLCIDFIANYEKQKKPIKQNINIKESFYTARKPKDNQLDINKTIKENFNLLRISSNEKFPSFFEIDGIKYILNIKKEDK